MIEIMQLSSLVKVFSDEKPTQQPFNKLSILKNEKASVQLAMCSDTDTVVNVTIKSDIADSINLHYVEELYSRTPIYKHISPDSYLLRKKPGMFPELLRPLSGSIELKACKWLSLWIEVAPSTPLPAGVHNVTIELTTGEGKHSATYTFDVIDAELPKQSLIFTNWFHTDCIATHYGLEDAVFSDRYWELVEKYLQVACDYGMNMVLTPIFTPPLDTKIGGERLTVQLVDVEQNNGVYSFKFDKLDKWIDMCDRVGIVYIELAHLFTQWGAKKCPKIMATVDGVYKRIFGWNTKASGRQYKKFLESFAPAIKEYIKNRGIQDRVFVHVSDEPHITTIHSYKKAAKLIDKHFGEFTTIDALSDYRFYKKGLVKLPIPANDHIEPFIGNVPDLWTYYCCVQVRGVSNRFFSMPSQRNRVLGYQLYKYNVKGFLHWGFNFWYKQFSVGPVDPFTETDAGGEFPSGDSYVVYPGENGTPLLSLRLKVFYDAFQDMRALQLLESLIGREQTLALLEDGTTPSITFKEYPHSDEWQLNKREQINEAIRAALLK